MKNKQNVLDFCIIIALAVFSFVYAMKYLSTLKEQEFYQCLFEPAVMMACDKGFVLTENKPAQLSDFLAIKTTSFDCKDLKDIGTQKPYPAVQAWFYLLFFTSLIWKIAGISWEQVNILTSVLFSLSILFSYGLFRLGMGRLLALVGALLFCFCIEHYQQLAFLRDYDTAPFILGAIFITSFILIQERSFLKQLILSSILGALVGVGYGFRPDILVIIPYVCIAFIFFWPGKFFNTLFRRLFCLVSVGVFFFIVTLPISLFFIKSEIPTAFFHFLYLGLTTSHTNFLFLQPSMYDLGYIFSDAFAFVNITAHGMYTLGLPVIMYMNKAYGIASFDLYKDIIFIFPADMYLRGLSSIYHIISYTPSVDFYGHIYSAPRMLWISTPLCIIFLSFYDKRLGLFLIFSLLYMMSYPGLVFQERHYFYLYSWWWWPIGFLLSSLFLYFTNRRFSQTVKLNFYQNKKSSTFILIGIVFFMICIIFILRTIQTMRVDNLIFSYLNAPSKELSFQINHDENKSLFVLNKNEIFMPLKNAPNKPIPENKDVSYIYNSNYAADTFGAKMLKLTLSNPKCIDKHAELSVLYQFPKGNGAFNFSRQFDLKLSGKDMVFMPIFYAGKIGLQGEFYPYAVSISSDSGNCLTQVGYIDNPHFYPLWISLVIPENWRRDKLYLQWDF